MDRYDLMVEVVRSGVWDQEADFEDIADWLTKWMCICYENKRTFDDDFSKMVRFGVEFYDRVDEEFLDSVYDAFKEQPKELDFSTPKFDLGDHVETILGDEVRKFQRGSVTKVDWNFVDSCWRYVIAGIDDSFAEDQLRKT